MNFKKFYKEIFGLKNEELLDVLDRESSYKRYKKGSILLKEGEIQQGIPFLKSGVCKGWLIDVDGNEVVDCLICNLGEPIVGASLLGEISPISIMALTSCEAVCVPKEVIENLMESSIEVQALYTQLSIKSLEKHRKIQQITSHTKLDTRYKWFLEEYKHIANKVSQKTVAAFIGVTEHWLSRNKTRILEEMKKDL